MPSSSMNRRQFLKRLGILGGGIIVYFNSFDRLAFARMQRTGFLGAQIELLRKSFANLAIAGVIVDGGYLYGVVLIIVGNAE